MIHSLLERNHAVESFHMIDEQTISRAVKLLLDSAPPGSKVILFGSFARGQGTAQSDLDFMVIEPKVPLELAETVRLREAVRGLPVAIDVLVVSTETFRYWAETPNTVYYQAAKEGRVYEQVA
jgi:predicted nucleotidyltransferase